jgi:hypothetical protein
LRPIGMRDRSIERYPKAAQKENVSRRSPP